MLIVLIGSIGPTSYRLLHHCTQGITGSNMKHQGGHVHLGKWPFIKQEPGEISTLSHMGSYSARHSSSSTQVKPVFLPQLGSPKPSQPTNRSGGHKHLLGKYSTCGYHPYIPTSYFTPPCTPFTHLIPINPHSLHSLISVVASLVSTLIYLCCLIFSLRPDEVESMMWGCRFGTHMWNTYQEDVCAPHCG